jgi:hypothetical protein
VGRKSLRVDLKRRGFHLNELYRLLAEGRPGGLDIKVGFFLH